MKEKVQITNRFGTLMSSCHALRNLEERYVWMQKPFNHHEENVVIRLGHSHLILHMLCHALSISNIKLYSFTLQFIKNLKDPLKTLLVEIRYC